MVLKPKALTWTAAKPENFEGGFAGSSGEWFAGGLFSGRSAEGVSDESVGVDGGRIATLGGDGLEGLVTILRGTLAALSSGDFGGVLPGVSAGAGRSWPGACGGRGFSGLAVEVATLVVNNCKYHAEDGS